MELNKIYHGDAYKLIKEIPSKSIDLIYTDIPYLYEYSKRGESLDMFSKVFIKEEHQLKSDSETDLTKGIDFAILDEFVRVLKNIYIYMG